jgi:hypothetical protein
MLIHEINGYEFHLPTSGGKAGKGQQKTSTIQVRKDNVIVRQFRFDVDSVESRRVAVRKAKAFASAHE